MANNKVTYLMKFILPIIFINYFISISMFTHTHVVNGVTIVHSHPYAADDNGTPTHSHTGAEIQLIHTLSTFYSTATVVLCILLGLFLTKEIYLYAKPPKAIPIITIFGLSRLRPPPVL